MLRYFWILVLDILAKLSECATEAWFLFIRDDLKSKLSDNWEISCDLRSLKTQISWLLVSGLRTFKNERVLGISR